MAFFSGAREAAYREGAKSVPGYGGGHAKVTGCAGPTAVVSGATEIAYREGAGSIPGDGEGNARLTGCVQAP